MLAVHWAPVSKTKAILKNGITKSKKGLYCFPLTGHKSLDRWWIYFFNQCGVRERKKYNGIVFRIKKEDFPAQFGHWIGSTNKDDFEKEIKSIQQLGKEFRDTIVFRLGEELARKKSIEYDPNESSEVFMRLGEQEIQQSPKVITEKRNDLNFMTYALEDYQIVLSNSIAPNRIMKVLPQGDAFGKAIRLKKKYGNKNQI